MKFGYMTEAVPKTAQSQSLGEESLATVELPYTITSIICVHVVCISYIYII